jgi:small-conductance mechanosensitive channel
MAGLSVQQAVTQTAAESAGNESLFVSSMLSAVVAVVILLVLRYLLVRVVKGKAEILVRDQRRWINRINNATTVIVLISLVFIWAPQLHTFALSLTAVAVAVVLTTKELLMCLTGGFLRAGTKPFDIGDWITVDNLTGEVMAITTMTTLIEEIDTTKTYQFTGRTVQIPNSKFLSNNVENSNFIKYYVYYDFQINVQIADLDPARLMAKLEDITKKYFAPFHEGAVKFNKKVERKAAVDFADPDPQFFLKTTDAGHAVFTVRFFIPTQKAAETGAAITRDFLSYVYNQRRKTKKRAKK